MKIRGTRRISGWHEPIYRGAVFIIVILTAAVADQSDDGAEEGRTDGLIPKGECVWVIFSERSQPPLEQ